MCILSIWTKEYLLQGFGVLYNGFSLSMFNSFNRYHTSLQWRPPLYYELCSSEPHFSAFSNTSDSLKSQGLAVTKTDHLWPLLNTPKNSHKYEHFTSYGALCLHQHAFWPLDFDFLHSKSYNFTIKGTDDLTSIALRHLVYQCRKIHYVGKMQVVNILTNKTN